MITCSLGLCCRGYQAVHRCGGDVKLTTKRAHAIAPTQFSHTITLTAFAAPPCTIDNDKLVKQRRGTILQPYMDMDDDTRDYMHMYFTALHGMKVEARLKSG